MANPSAQDIVARLQSGAAAASDLMRDLGVSQPTISRLTSRLVRDKRVLRIGATRGARYALRREVASLGSSWPAYRVDAAGNARQVGVLQALAANQFHFEASDPALAAVSGLSDGLPYFLQDQRPAGFLGRLVPRRYPELHLPQRVADWTDDHYLAYLTQRGSGTVSDLIVGEASMDRHLAGDADEVIAERERTACYPKLARETMSGGIPGSSAHGENPKFAAKVRRREGAASVLVKFSPPRDTETGRRWSDLLVAEHLAHVALETAGIPSCRSEILEAGDRTFLEMIRFDRAGATGRVGVTSLHAVDLRRYGKLDEWTAAAERLSADGILGEQDVERIRFLAAFGAAIANTDRHFGNIAFLDQYDGQLALAPAYDMLPMLFAPAHEQIVPRAFEPPTPSARTLSVWESALALARVYWSEIASDRRVSAGFRKIAAECDRRLGGTMRRR